MSWRNEPVNEIEGWFSGYTRRRYGSFNENALNAWKVLLPNVLNSTCKFPNRKVLISHLPSLSLTDYLWYNVSDIATSWDYLFKARNELHTKEGYRYEFMVQIMRCLFGIILKLEQPNILDKFSSHKIIIGSTWLISQDNLWLM